jgi:hypothetical protein
MHKISMNRRQIFVVHSLSQAKAAISAAAERDSAVTLLSAPGAAAYAGAAWFSAIVKTARESQPRVEVQAILDCGARADLVQAAFRQGVTQVVFRGDARLLRPLRGIARQQGATILRRRPAACDLRHAKDAGAACRAWLEHPANVNGAGLKKRRPSAIQKTASRGKKKRGS